MKMTAMTAKHAPRGQASHGQAAQCAAQRRLAARAAAHAQIVNLSAPTANRRRFKATRLRQTPPVLGMARRHGLGDLAPLLNVAPVEQDVGV